MFRYSFIALGRYALALRLVRVGTHLAPIPLYRIPIYQMMGKCAKHPCAKGSLVQHVYDTMDTLSEFEIVLAGQVNEPPEQGLHVIADSCIRVLRDV